LDPPCQQDALLLAAGQRGAHVADQAVVGHRHLANRLVDAGELIASHNAAMECYRRAMIPGQTFEGRRENLNQGEQALPDLRGSDRLPARAVFRAIISPGSSDP
jgi:hypothetical protein